MKTLEQALAESIITNYPAAFQTGMGFVLPHEVSFEHGHYDDYDHVRTEHVPNDPGGSTKYGIDRKAHPNVDIDGLDLDGAIQIYWNTYWQGHDCDQLPDKLGIAAFDVWVNGGHANVWLQHAYNESIDVKGNESLSLKEDGNLGPASLAALQACDQDAVLASFLAQRQARFNHLAQQPDYSSFLAGWTQRNEDLAALLA